MIHFFVNTDNKLLILHQNIAGYLSKKDILEVTLQNLKECNKPIDIICLSETFIIQGDELNLKLSGFLLADSFSRTKHRRGGVCIFCRDNIAFRKISSLNCLSQDFCFELCGIELSDIKCTIICIYRTPNSNPLTFLEQLEKLLFNLRHKINSNIIITGDFNIDLLKNTNIKTNFIRITEIFNFIIHIREPTRGNSCLDQILSNIPQATGEILNLNLSDHNTGQLLTVPLQKKHILPKAKYIMRRDYNSDNILKFCNCISQLSWSEVYTENDADKAFTTFHELLNLFYNLCFPLMKIKLKVKSNKLSWISKGIKISSKTQRKLRYTYYKYKKEELKYQYKKYNKTFKKCLSAGQKINNQKIMDNSKNKCQASWSLIKDNTTVKNNNTFINTINYNNINYNNPIDIANIFNNYFIDLTTKNTIINLNYKYKIDINYSTIFLTPTNDTEVFKIIMNLKNTTSVGYDQITTKIIKKSSKIIAQILSHLINLSLLSGVFPTKLKTSVIRPIYKKGDKTLLNNYRPIALIPILSKVFERVVYIRILNFIEKHSILTPDQNGFRKNKSTSLAAFNIVNNILENVDNRLSTVGVFFDMSRAFDFVSHELLLWKCERYGIRGRPLEWLHSYLTNRSQYVEINSVNTTTQEEEFVKSSIKYNKVGVPQGSILGPLLFILYINDITQITNCRCSLFADDIAIVIPDNFTDNYNNKINLNIDKIVTWLRDNNLEINVLKTKYIQFGNRGTKKLDLNVRYKNEPITETDSIKFLGIQLDRWFTWKEHIENLCSKISRFVYPLWRLPKICNLTTALKAYHGYVASNLRYGILLWGNSVHTSSIFIAQKRCIRALYGVSPHTSCKPLFKDLKLLTLTSIYIFEVCVFVRTHMHLFEKKGEKCKFATRYPDRLCLPPSRTAMRSRNAYHMCVTIYNKIPNKFKNLTLNKFKKQLHEWLVEKCFYTLKEFMP